MRGEVRAKERGVWGRLTNQLYAGNGTNHGYSSGLCCSLFISLFSYIFVLFTSLFVITLSSTFPPLFHWCLPHKLCDWASHTSLSLTPTSVLPEIILPIPPSIPPQGLFSLLHQTLPSPLVSYSLPTLLHTVHSPSPDYYAVCSHWGDAHTIHHNVQILSA